MKWLLFFKEKTKLFFLLPVMILLLITLIVASKKQISQVDRSVQSIYHDRLVAGRAITQIMDLHYQNHLLIDKYIQADTLFRQALLEEQVAYNHRRTLNSKCIGNQGCCRIEY
jgi:hypothetical protein